MTMTANSIVSIAGLNKWFGDFHVLRDIDLDIAKGERIVICGPSGSGKSTLIRCINALEEFRKAGSSSTASSSGRICGASTMCGAKWVWCSRASICFRT